MNIIKKHLVLLIILLLIGTIFLLNGCGGVNKAVSDLIQTETENQNTNEEQTESENQVSNLEFSLNFKDNLCKFGKISLVNTNNKELTEEQTFNIEKDNAFVIFSDLAVGDWDYALTFYDQNNNIIGTETDSFYCYKNETKKITKNIDNFQGDISISFPLPEIKRIKKVK